jgi:hypothetical protein
MARDKPYRYAKEDKSSTVILIAVLLVLIVVIGGGLLFIISQKGATQVPPTNITNNTPPPPTPTNITNATPTCDDQCLLSRAQSSANFSECQMISSDQLKQQCYESLSNSSLDACEAVSDPAKKSACVTSFAVSMKDIGVCDALANKTSCQLAVNPCLNATDMLLCAAIRDNNPVECQSNDSCILNYSFAKKNSTSCSMISDPVMAKACQSSVTFSDHCADLPAQLNKDQCYQLYATYTNDYLECTQITPESNAQLSCIEYFAAKQQDLTICSYFMLDQRWACLRYYSLATGDLSGCRAIDPLATTNLFQCAFNYSIAYGNPAACEVINITGERSTCYQGSIIYQNQNLDYHYCANVTNFVWGNKCYTEAAKIDNNVSICDLIATDYARQSCKDSYAANKTGQ